MTLPQPLGRRVLIRPIVDDEFKTQQDSPFATTASGMLIPKEVVNRERSSQVEGTVVAISDSVGDCDLEIGDHVLYARFGGVFVDHAGDRYILLHVDDVTCRLTPQSSVETKPRSINKMKG